MKFLSVHGPNNFVMSRGSLGKTLHMVNYIVLFLHETPSPKIASCSFKFKHSCDVGYVINTKKLAFAVKRFVHELYIMPNMTWFRRMCKKPRLKLDHHFSLIVYLWL